MSSEICHFPTSTSEPSQPFSRVVCYLRVRILIHITRRYGVHVNIVVVDVLSVVSRNVQQAPRTSVYIMVYGHL